MDKLFGRVKMEMALLRERLRKIASALHLRFKKLRVWRRLQPVMRGWGFERGQPIDRYYIELFLEKNRGDIRGRVLEFLDSKYTRKFGGDRVVQSDVLNVEANIPGSTFIADLASADQIPSGVFDCIICTQTLQYVFDLNAAVGHLHRILKPGGVILATLPCVSKVAAEWSDCWRFTSVSAKRLFCNVFGPDHVDVKSWGNLLTSISFLHGLVAQECKQKQLEYFDPEYEMLITVRAVKPFPK